jgi:hypothetical protein
MYVNVSGDYDGIKLKEYADKMQDHFEEHLRSPGQRSWVHQNEIQVNVDPYKMTAAKISFTDVKMRSAGRTMI